VYNGTFRYQSTSDDIAHRSAMLDGTMVYTNFKQRRVPRRVLESKDLRSMSNLLILSLSQSYIFRQSCAYVSRALGLPAHDSQRSVNCRKSISSDSKKTLKSFFFSEIFFSYIYGKAPVSTRFPIHGIKYDNCNKKKTQVFFPMKLRLSILY
jgi:hypothetical protein